MSFVQKIWKDRVTEHPNRRIFTPVSGATNTYDAARAEGNIMAEGDPLNAANLNDLEQRVADEFGTKGKAGGIMGLPSTLPAIGTILKMAAGGVPTAAIEDTDYFAPHSPVSLTGFKNGWANYGDVFDVAKAVKIGNEVFLSGLIKGGAVTAGTEILTLPTGYRPIANQIFSCAAPVYGAVRVDVSAAGSINISTAPDGSTINPAYLSLCGIRFPIA